MKSKLALLATLLTVSALSHASDGTVNFNGKIIDAACTVTPDTADQKVTLGKINKTAFTGPTSTAGSTAFQIDLTACPANMTSASIRFGGAPYEGDNSLIAFTPEVGAATGVGLQIRTTTNMIIPLQLNHAITLVPGATNSVKFKALYAARSATVTPGPANAIVTFNVIYN